MRVAQINVTFGNADSTGRNVKELHEFLLESGMDSHVYVTAVNDCSEIDKRIHFFSSQLDKRSHALLSRLTGMQGYFSYFSTQKLISELNELKPDVVMLHVLHSNCMNFPSLFAFLANNHIATIVVLHDCWYYTGHCCHYTSAGCGKWKKECGKCPLIHQWNKSWFFDFSKKALADKKSWFESLQCVGVVGVSDWIAGEAKKSILKDAAVIQRIYNWIDLETFRPRDTMDLRKQLGILENEKVLLGVASAWGEQKGLQEMLMAAKSIPDSKVIMVGQMPENVEIPENMLCVGLVRDPVMLSEYYSMADLFLNPSVQETFGKTTAEAMSCGTPAVVYKTTACPELIAEGCGGVVPAYDKEVYVNSVGIMLQKIPDDTSEKCRKSAVSQFSKHVVLPQYLALMNRLLDYA